MTKEQEQIYLWVVEVLARKLSMREFSVLTGKSYRQCQRIVAKVKMNGLLGVRHGNTGRKPKNRIDANLTSHIRELIQHKYYDFNVTHLREKLFELENIQIPYETLRRIAHTVGVPKKARKRRRKKAHCLRPRMPKEGMLVQFDGSEHRWFSGSNLIATLIGGIDDATGKILSLQFSCSEDTFSCFRVMREIVENHGVPEAFYLDRASHFGRFDQNQSDTQIGRALEELGSKVILASSPQAKGRIERLWGTLQDRLIAELRLRGINRIERANEYLKNEFIGLFNSQFTVTPREQEKAYKRIPTHLNLDLVFGIKEQRKIAANQTFSFNGTMYLLHTDQDLRYRTVEICSNELERQRYLVYGREFKATPITDIEEKPLKIAA